MVRKRNRTWSICTARPAGVPRVAAASKQCLLLGAWVGGSAASSCADGGGGGEENSAELAYARMDDWPAFEPTIIRPCMKANSLALAFTKSVVESVCEVVTGVRPGGHMSTK